MTPRARKKVLQNIRLVATDVDGVLTDGGMYIGESGEELKKFNTRDGMGLKLLQQAGIITAFITQEKTRIVAARGAKLKVPEIHQGIMNKLAMVEQLVKKYGLSLDQVAYIGDDINDLSTLQAVGFSATPADGMPVVKKEVDHICRLKGGEGAVREVADMILAAQSKND